MEGSDICDPVIAMRKRKVSNESSKMPQKLPKLDVDSPDSAIGSEGTAENQDKAKKKELQSEKFRYGNFHRYYGSRLQGVQRDPRLDVLPKFWFKSKNVLDIGCNAGYLTLTIAKEYESAWVLGIDIDPHLVGVARSNIAHYTDEECKGRFPKSLVSEAATTPKHSRQPPKPSAVIKPFPHNVWFRYQNYVCTMEEELQQTIPEYDVILALSITKWVHLNWGDNGITAFFRRAFLNLRPGGRLIIEPQDFSTYWKRAKQLEDMRQTYHGIQLKPEQFKSYLIDEVGFEEGDKLDIPHAISKGFERPLEVYQKPFKVKKTNGKKRKNKTKEIE